MGFTVAAAKMLSKAVKRNIKLTLLTIGGFVLSSSFILFLLPMVLVFWVLSEIVYLILKIKFGNKAHRPSGMDTLQGMENEKSRAYINTIGRFNGKVDLKEMKKAFKERILDAVDDKGEKLFKRLTQVFERHFGYYLFRDADDFDLDKHFYMITMEDLIPKGQTPSDLIINVGEKEFTDVNLNKRSNVSKHPSVTATMDWQTLCNVFLKKFGTRPIEEGRPKWEIVLLPHDNGFTCIYRIHHSITDGIYFTRCILEVLGDKPVNFHPFYNYHQPNFFKRMVDRLWAFCLIPYGVFRLCFSYEKNPLHGPPLTGKKEYLISKRIPLPLLKDVKKRAKVSMSTVLFSCTSYALTCHFRRRKANISNIIVLIPVGLQDMSKPVTFKNSFALKGSILPTAIESKKGSKNHEPIESALRRLKEVDRNLYRTKKDASFLAIHYLCITLGKLLPSFITRKLLTTKGLTTSFSNVAGPQGEDLFLLGNKQEDIAFWVPDRGPMGMGVSVTGWNGNVLVGLMADTGLIPTAEEGNQFLNDLVDEVYNLQNELNLAEAQENLEEKMELLPNSAIP